MLLQRAEAVQGERQVRCGWRAFFFSSRRGFGYPSPLFLLREAEESVTGSHLGFCTWPSGAVSVPRNGAFETWMIMCARLDQVQVRNFHKRQAAFLFKPPPLNLFVYINPHTVSVVVSIDWSLMLKWHIMRTSLLHIILLSHVARSGLTMLMFQLRLWWNCP